MSRSYKATGINLKAIPLGETDRLLTILTVEQGLIRAVAPGARKHKSRLGGRSGQFVVNELLVVEGKHLDKVIQAETVQSFPGLSTHLGKLTASQYLAELVLCQALSGQSQESLFALFVEHLQRLEQAPVEGVMASLCQGIFHLLVLAGVAPEVQCCCLSQQPIVPDLMGAPWQAGFSAIAGGIVHPSYLSAPELHPPQRNQGRSGAYRSGFQGTRGARVQAGEGHYKEHDSVASYAHASHPNASHSKFNASEFDAPDYPFDNSLGDDQGQGAMPRQHNAEANQEFLPASDGSLNNKSGVTPLGKAPPLGENKDTERHGTDRGKGQTRSPAPTGNRYSSRGSTSHGASLVLISAMELALLQRLGQPELWITQGIPGVTTTEEVPFTQGLWTRIEGLLRQWTEYHFDRPIRSASLLETCFTPLVDSYP